MDEGQIRNSTGTVNNLPNKAGASSALDPQVTIHQVHKALVMKVTVFSAENKQISLNEFGSEVVINLQNKYSILSLRDLLIKEMPLTLEEINALTPAAVKEVLTR